MGEQFPSSFESDLDSFDSIFDEVYSDRSEADEMHREQTKSELVEAFGSQQFQYGSHVGTVYDIVEVCPHIKDMLDRGVGANTIASEIAPFAVDLQPEEVLETEEPKLGTPVVETIDIDDAKSAEVKSDPEISSPAEKSQAASPTAESESESQSAMTNDVSTEKSDTNSPAESADRADNAPSDEQSIDDYGGDVVVVAAVHESATNDTQSDKQASRREEKVAAKQPVKAMPKQLEPKEIQVESSSDAKSATIDANANKPDVVEASIQDIKSELKAAESIKVSKQNTETILDQAVLEKSAPAAEKSEVKRVVDIQPSTAEVLDMSGRNQTETIETDDVAQDVISTEVNSTHEVEFQDVTQPEHIPETPEAYEEIKAYEDSPAVIPEQDIETSEVAEDAAEIEGSEPQDIELDFETIEPDEEIDQIELEEFHELDETEFEPVELEIEFIEELAKFDDESDERLIEELLSDIEPDLETIDLGPKTSETVEDIERFDFSDEELVADELIESQINTDETGIDPGVEFGTTHGELAESIDSEEIGIESTPIEQISQEIIEVLDITLDQEAEYLPEEFHRNLKQFERNIATLKQATSAEECNDSLEAIRASLVEILDALGCYDSEITAKYLMERHTLSELHELLIRLQKELTEKNRSKHTSTGHLSADIAQLIGHYVMSSYRKVWAS